MAVKVSWVDNHLTELIQPTSLRAPEVILRAKWGPSERGVRGQFFDVQ